MSSFVAAQRGYGADRARSIRNWADLVYPGDITGTTNRASPAAAARVIEEHPDMTQGDAYLACAAGDLAALREMTKRDAAWLDRPGGPLNLPPLVAVTHSSLVRLPRFRDALRAAPGSCWRPAPIPIRPSAAGGRPTAWKDPRKSSGSPRSTARRGRTTTRR